MLIGKRASTGHASFAIFLNFSGAGSARLRSRNVELSHDLISRQRLGGRRWLRSCSSAHFAFFTLQCSFCSHAFPFSVPLRPLLEPIRRHEDLCAGAVKLDETANSLLPVVEQEREFRPIRGSVHSACFERGPLTQTHWVKRITKARKSDSTKGRRPVLRRCSAPCRFFDDACAGLACHFRPRRRAAESGANDADKRSASNRRS